MNEVSKNYSVSIYYSKAHFPFYFAIHPWVVIENGRQKNRYEILHTKNSDSKMGYLHKNAFPETSSGLLKFRKGEKRHSAKLLTKISSKTNNSLKKRILEFENYYLATPTKIVTHYTLGQIQILLFSLYLIAFQRYKKNYRLTLLVKIMENKKYPMGIFY